MNSEQSKTFFRKLKEVCSKIDCDISDIKRKLNEVSENDSDLAAKSVSNIQDKIQKLKTEANELKFKLEPKLVHTANFIQHFTELTTETEVAIANIENNLQQYGYTPSNVTASSQSEEKSLSPVKNVCHQEPDHLSKTPILMDYGIASHDFPVNHSSQLKERSSSFEDLAVPPMMPLKNYVKDKESSGSTPTLEVNIISQKETPPVPESLPPIAVLPSTPTLEL